MSPHLAQYVRVSTNHQDLQLPTSRTQGPRRPGRPGLRRSRPHQQEPGTPGAQQALAACRTGDTLAVAKLDLLVRSLPDARDIVEDLTKRNIKLNLGGAIHDPIDPVGRLLSNVLAMVAEFDSDLIRACTREGMQIAKAKGKLRVKQPKLSLAQEKHLITLYKGGQHTSAEKPNSSASRRARCTASCSGPPEPSPLHGRASYQPVLLRLSNAV